MKLPTPPARPNLTAESELMQKYNEALVIYNDEMLEFTNKYEKSVKFWSENATVK